MKSSLVTWGRLCVRPNLHLCKIMFVSSLLASLTSPSSQAQWTMTNPAAAGNTLQSVSCVDPDTDSLPTCFAVGESGTLVKVFFDETDSRWELEGVVSQTTSNMNDIDCPTPSFCMAVGNNGATMYWDESVWTVVATPTANHLNGVVCLSATFCKAAGASGTLLSWNGTAWSDESMGTTESLFGLDCTSVSACMAVGGNGKAFFWNGTTWSTSTTGTIETLNGISCFDTACTAVGDNGTVLRWESSAWASQTSGSTSHFLDVSCANASWCVAVQAGGNIMDWNSLDWTLIDNLTSTNLYGVSCTYDEGVNSFCIGVGESGVAVLSDSGNAWKYATGGIVQNLRDSSCPDANTCVMVSDDGRVFYKNNNEWLHEVPVSAATWNSVACTNSVCFAVGNGGEIARWSGVGFSWERVEANLTTENLKAISCISSSSCVAVGDNGTLVRMSSGVWSLLSSPSTANLNGVFCRSGTPVVCVATGDNGVVLRGNTSSFNVQSTGSTQNLYGVHCLNGTYCLAVGAGGTILKWNGTNWTAQTSTTTATLLDVDCVSANLCMVVGENGTIVRWLDTAWGTMTSGTTQTLRSIDVSSGDLAVALAKTAVNYYATATGDGGLMLYIADAALPVTFTAVQTQITGQTATISWRTAQEINSDYFVIERQTATGWEVLQRIQSAGNSHRPQAYQLSIPNLAYGTHTFRITEYSLNGVATHSRPFEVRIQLADTFALSEAYPNPFNPQTQFTLTVARTQNVQIRVYNLLGREVGQVFSGRLAGQETHAFQLDGNAWASGLYVIQIVGESFNATRKVSLAK